MPIDLNNPNIPDSDVVDAFVAMLAPEARLVLGPAVRELVTQAGQRERLRCIHMVLQASNVHETKARELEAPLRAAYGTPAMQELGVTQAVQIDLARALRAVAGLLKVAPGSCRQCRGTKVVPSGLAAPDGTQILRTCPSCAGSAPQEGSVSEMSSASEPSATSSAEQVPGTTPEG